MVQYNVKGMSCSACSARVEKAVLKVPGVTSCTVSLLTNSMGVEGTASPESIVAAVKAAGYKASLKKGVGKPAGGTAAAAAAGATAAAATGTSATEADDALADTETPQLRKRLSA